MASKPLYNAKMARPVLKGEINMSENKLDCNYNSFGYCRNGKYSYGYCQDTDDCPYKIQKTLNFEESEAEDV